MTTDPRPDLCVFVGRFQPLHQGHVSVMQEALRRADRLLVLVGSANEPRSFRNPFNAEERCSLVVGALAPQERDRVAVMPLEDSNYHLEGWIESVQRAVATAWQKMCNGDVDREPSVALIGHSKDASSYYLKLFPEWEAVSVAHARGLDATALRKHLFGDASLVDSFFQGDEEQGNYAERYFNLAQARAQHFLARAELTNEIPDNVAEFLGAFVDTSDYRQIADEYAHVARYQHQWRDAPYPPTFVTADALVVQSGHVLAVKRKGYPGHGLWALPGGFVDQHESIENAMLRELTEETRLAVPTAVLRNRIAARKVFDNPYRSSRGRTITHAFLVQLEPGPLPSIEAADDAQAAEWLPLSQLDRSRFFEDHYAIIRNLVGSA